MKKVVPKNCPFCGAPACDGGYLGMWRIDHKDSCYFGRDGGERGAVHLFTFDDCRIKAWNIRREGSRHESEVQEASGESVGGSGDGA